MSFQHNGRMLYHYAHIQLDSVTKFLELGLQKTYIPMSPNDQTLEQSLCTFGEEKTEACVFFSLIGNHTQNYYQNHQLVAYVLLHKNNPFYFHTVKYSLSRKPGEIFSFQVHNPSKALGAKQFIDKNEITFTEVQQIFDNSKYVVDCAEEIKQQLVKLRDALVQHEEQTNPIHSTVSSTTLSLENLMKLQQALSKTTTTTAQ